MPVITFLPLGFKIVARDGESIFTAAQRENIPIPTACVGKATCGLCRVKIIEGEAFLSPLNDAEKKHLGNTYFITKLRLSCQARVAGDVVVRLPDAPKR